MAAPERDLSLILGVLGFCCAMLTGSTGASVGVLFGGLFALFARGSCCSPGVGGPAQSLDPRGERAGHRRHGTTYWLPTPGSTWDDDSEGIERQ